MKISFLGGGNMAVALIGGLLAKGYAAGDIQVAEHHPESRQRLADKFGVRAVPALDEAALACEVLLLAVKPQQMREALAPLAGRLGPQLVVSIAAGLRMADLSRWLGGHRRLVRCMPNTPALIGAGVTGLCADPSVDEAGRAAAEAILAAVGDAVWIADEARMDAVTALSGSGPAYVFHFIEALIGAGVTGLCADPSVDEAGRAAAEAILAAVGDAVWIAEEARMDAVTALSGSGPAYVFHFIEALEAAGCGLGFDAATARRLAIGTVLGAARLAAESGESPATLRERVTSKGGTTEAALTQMAADGFLPLVARALQAAAVRGRELGDELGGGHRGRAAG